MCFKYSILVSNLSDDSIFMLRFWIVCADMALLFIFASIKSYVL